MNAIYYYFTLKKLKKYTESLLVIMDEDGMKC
jgi:hypothetical protein